MADDHEQREECRRDFNVLFGKMDKTMPKSMAYALITVMTLVVGAACGLTLRSSSELHREIKEDTAEQIKAMKEDTEKKIAVMREETRTLVSMMTGQIENIRNDLIDVRSEQAVSKSEYGHLRQDISKIKDDITTVQSDGRRTIEVMTDIKVHLAVLQGKMDKLNGKEDK